MTRKTICLLFLLNGWIATTLWAQEYNFESSNAEKKPSFALFEGEEWDDDPNPPGGGGGLGDVVPVGDGWWICAAGAVLFSLLRVRTNNRPESTIEHKKMMK